MLRYYIVLSPDYGKAFECYSSRVKEKLILSFFQGDFYKKVLCFLFCSSLRGEAITLIKLIVS